MDGHGNAAAPFASLTDLRRAYRRTVQRLRDEGATAAVLADMATFILRGRASGVILADVQDRDEVQSLLTYLANECMRARHVYLDATLADFDPDLLPELADDRCPYRGLTAFRDVDYHLFFGRQDLVTEMVAQVHTQRLLAVVGPSGSGKSSLVVAGLLPALRAGAVPGSADWCYLPPIVPGATPLESLARLCMAEGSGAGTAAPAMAAQPQVADPENLMASVAALRTDPAQIRSYLRLHDESQAPIVLTIDQFEEVFTLCTDEDETQAFIAALVAVLTAPGIRHTLILTMRSDFETVLTRVPAFHAQFVAARVKVPPLSRDGLRKAIEEPGKAVGLRFEPGVVDALLQDILGEPAGLPLLQFTLRKLWEYRERNRITLAAYQRVGGGRQALAQSADAWYHALIPEEQATVRRILLHIVQAGEGFEVTSHRTTHERLLQIGEDPDRVQRVLTKLIQAGLVRVSPGSTPGATHIEVAHEALVRNWPTLVKWLDDEKVTMTILRRLELQAKEWVRLGRGSGGLLDQVALHEAERWIARAETTGLGYDAVIQAFVQASRVAVTNEARRQKAVVQYLKHLNRELREHQRVIDTQRLAFAAQSLVHTAPETALLLACEAAMRDDNAVTAQALRDVIDQVHWRPVLLRCHTGPVTSVAIDRAGTYLATASTDGTIALWSMQGTLLVQWTGHPAPITRVVIHPDGHWLATASADGTARLWKRDTGEELRCFSGHTDVVDHVVFHPNGHWLATASPDRTTRLWNLHDTTTLVLAGHNGSVTAIGFSPDGQRMVTASEDWTARVWDCRTGQMLILLDAHTGTVCSAMSSPDGQRIVTASEDRTARIWTCTGHPLLVLEQHTGTVCHAVWSPDGQRIVTVSDDGTTCLWESATGAVVAVLRGHVRTVVDIFFAPDGQRFGTVSDDQTVRLWSTTGMPLDTLSGHTGPIFQAAFSPDGHQIVTASADGTARLWRATEPALATLIGHTGQVYNAAFSPDGHQIVTASADGTARLWERTGREIRALGSTVGAIYSAIMDVDDVTARNSYVLPVYNALFSPDGRWIVLLSEDQVAWVWDRTGTIRLPLRGHTRTVQSAAFSPDSHYLVTASADRTARLWHVTGQPLPILRGHGGMVRSVAFRPDGQWIVTASVDRTARVWDTSGTTRAVLAGHTEPLATACFSPDGSAIVTASEDGTARIWDCSGTVLAVLTGHTAPVWNAIFSPDGHRVLTVSEDGTARLWQHTGDLVTTLSGHTDWVLSAAFSPDGQYMVTTSADRTARLWTIDGQHSAILTGHTGPVRSARFSPDGQRVITASDDFTVRQYLVHTNALLSIAAQRVGRNMTSEEIHRFQVPTPLVFDAAQDAGP
jgi:WD40 repeat protein